MKNTEECTFFRSGNISFRPILGFTAGVNIQILSFFQFCNDPTVNFSLVQHADIILFYIHLSTY